MLYSVLAILCIVQYIMQSELLNKNLAEREINKVGVE